MEPDNTMTTYHRRTVGLDHKAHEVITGIGNVSKYISSIVKYHHMQWQSQYQILKEMLWSAKEIALGCETLCKAPLIFDDDRHAAIPLAQELQSADDPKVWERICISTAEDYEMAKAINLLSLEHRFRNQNFLRQLKLQQEAEHKLSIKSCEQDLKG
jgi:hypothetical protein